MFRATNPPSLPAAPTAQPLLIAQRLLTALAVLIALAVLGACGDDSSSDNTANITASQSSSNTPGVTPPITGSTGGAITGGGGAAQSIAGGAGGGAPITGPANVPAEVTDNSPCMKSDPSTSQASVIDDAESGSGAISGDGRMGKWFATNDGATQQTPGDSVNLTMGAGIEGPGAGGSQYAVHTTLNIPDNSPWGGAIELDFNSPSGGKDAGDRKPYDASAYEGIQFMIKGKGSVSVRLLTTETVPSNQGGSCNDGDKCSDSHQASLSVPAEWKEVKVPFSAVAQDGFGTAAPFNPASLIGIAFQSNSPGEHEIWVDDLAFYGGTGGADCSKYPGDPSCEATLDYCTTCSTDPRCKCVLEECITTGVKEGPLACSGDSSKMYNGGSTRYWIDQASSDRDKSGGYQTLGCGIPVMGTGSNGSGDKVLGAPGDGTLFAAINSADLGEAATLCGACVRVNDKVTVQIVDECPNRAGQQKNPKCTSGHLDLSVAAANQVGGDNPGISWNLVPCENPTPEYVWLKDSQVYWGSLVIAGLKYPARKVELRSGSAWAEGKRKPYWGAWIFGTDKDIPGSSGTIPPAPWTVRITDINGQVMIDTFGEAGDPYETASEGGKVKAHQSQGMVQLPECGM